MSDLLHLLTAAQSASEATGISTPVQWTLLTLLITSVGGLFIRHEKIRDRNEDRLVEQNREVVAELRTLQKTVIDDVVPALVHNNDTMRDLAAEVREWSRHQNWNRP